MLRIADFKFYIDDVEMSFDNFTKDIVESPNQVAKIQVPSINKEVVFEIAPNKLSCYSYEDGSFTTVHSILTQIDTAINVLRQQNDSKKD